MSVDPEAFPSAQEIGSDFDFYVSWFAEWYSEEQTRLCAERGYTGPTKPYDHAKVRGRLRYMFAVPGRAKRTRAHKGPSDRPVKRQYGVGPEHPKHPAQCNSGGRDIWAKCSGEIERRILSRTPITRAEIAAWGHTQPESLFS